MWALWILYTQVWSEISVFTLHYQPYESQLFFAIDYVFALEF